MNNFSLKELRGIADEYYSYAREIFLKIKKDELDNTQFKICVKKQENNNNFNVVYLIHPKLKESIRGYLLIIKRDKASYEGFSFINKKVIENKQEFYYTVLHEFSHFVLFLEKEEETYNQKEYFEQIKTNINIAEIIQKVPTLKETLQFKDFINKSVITDNNEEILKRINSPTEYPVCTLSRFFILPTSLLLLKIDENNNNDLSSFFNHLYENFLVPHHVILQRLIEENKLNFFLKKITKRIKIA